MKNKLGIALPVLGTREYTDLLIPQIVEEIENYFYDIPVCLVMHDSGGHEDFSDLNNHPELKRITEEYPFEFKYIKVENPSQSLYYTWNQGVIESEADHALVINNDILFIDRALYDLYAVMESGYDFVVPVNVMTREEITEDRANPSDNITLHDGKLHLCGWCFGISNEFFKNNHFNETYRLWYGDTEVFARARKFGKVATVGSSPVFHFFSKTMAKFNEEEFKKIVKNDFHLCKVVEKELGIDIDIRSEEQFDSMLETYWKNITKNDKVGV